MHWGPIIAIIVFVLVCAVVVKKAQNRTKEIEPKNEMEELFFTEVRNGEKSCKLTHIIDEVEFSFIETLLQTERIPYHTEIDNALNIWPSMKLGAWGNVNIYILEKNYDETIKIIEENRKGNG